MLDPSQIITWLLVVNVILVSGLVIVAVMFFRHRQSDRGTTALTDLMAKQLEIFGQTREKLGQLSSIGEQVDRLSSTLQQTQQRGVWGEQILEVILDSLLPNYHGPYTFNDGKKVEQALRLPDGKIIAIDSKFVLDAYRQLENATSEQEANRARANLARSLRDRIDETAKYIRPAEGTLDFALMFLPAEAVYYHLCSDNDFCVQDGGGRHPKRVWDYALERRVIPVSPNTLYAYVTVIVYGLRGLQIEQRTKEILNHLQQLQIEFDKLYRDWGTLGSHLKNARLKYEDLDSAMIRFGERANVDKLADLPGDGLPRVDIPSAHPDEP